MTGHRCCTVCGQVLTGGPRAVTCSPACRKAASRRKARSAGDGNLRNRLEPIVWKLRADGQIDAAQALALVLFPSERLLNYLARGEAAA